MNCPRIQLLLSEYLDGDLNAQQAKAVEQHLAACPDCTQLWRELRGTVRMVGHYGRQRCPVDLRSSVMQAVAYTPARPRAHFYFRRLLTAVAGSSVILAGLALPLLLHPSISPIPWKDGIVRPPLAPAELAPVHIQYNMATSLGTTDGLLLSLPSNSEGVPHEPQNQIQR